MIERLREMPGPVLAVAILLALLAGAYLVIVAPIANHVAGLIEQIGNEHALAARYGAALSARETDGSRPPEAPIGLMIDGETESIAAARLQALVSDVAARAGVSRVKSARPRALVERDRLKLIGMELDVTVGMAELQRLLVGIEAARPVLIVEGVQISPTPSPVEPGRRSGVQTLDVRLEVLAATNLKSAALAPRADRGNAVVLDQNR